MDNSQGYISQDRQETFERYVMGQMTHDEQSRFERRLDEDSTFKQSYSTFKALFEAVEEDALKEKLVEFHEVFEPSVDTYPKNRANRRRTFLMAASVAALVALGATLYLNRQNTNEILFEEYFSPDPGLPTVMGNSENYAFYRSMVDYKRGRYETAIEQWEEQLAKQPENDTLQYFVGVTELALGNADGSISHLKKVVEKDSSAFTMYSYHYLGLSYLKKGNKKLAQTYLRQSNLTKSKLLLQEVTHEEE